MIEQFIKKKPPHGHEAPSTTKFKMRQNDYHQPLKQFIETSFI